MDNPFAPPLMNAAQLAVYLRENVPSQYLRDAAVLDDVAARWFERQRAWHGPNHLGDMLDSIHMMASDEERDVLLLAAAYHDAIYDPRAADNEEASAKLLLSHAADAKSSVITRAAEIICVSKWSEPPTSPLCRHFFDLDTRQLGDDCPLHERMAYERAIFREYQWVDFATYREKRREFLQRWKLVFPQHRRGVDETLEVLDGFSPKIGVYPGSFAPFHLGHLSILRQAEAIFDKVTVAVGINRQKPGAIETSQARFAELQSQLRFHEVASFSGLLTTFAGSQPIVRGIRDGTDVEAELRFTRFLQDLRADTQVVWISCGAELQHLSSSAIRELELIQPGAGRRYVPDATAIYGLVPGES